MTQKKYFTILLGAITLFLGYHLLMWNFFTSKIFGLDDKHSIGDLARMSYQIDMLYKRELRYTLAKSFIYKDIYNPEEKIDLITMGDSFAHGGGGGTNPYFQDYIATNYNLKVLNIEPDDPYDYFATIVGLYKSGFLQHSGAKYFLLESVERFFPRRFSGDLNITSYKPKNVHVTSKTFSIQHLNVPIISTANYKIPYYYLMYKLKDNAKKDVYRLQLSSKLFTKITNNDALFLNGDIKNIPQFTQENIIKINNNLNKIAKLLRSINIQLIVLPAPDKYDLYSIYIQDSYPENPFFKIIRELSKDYFFIDTKKILSKELEQNQKDIYFPDDTHWNYKASQAVFTDITVKNIFLKESKK